MHPQSSAMCSSCSVKVSGMVPLRCTPEFYRVRGQGSTLQGHHVVGVAFGVTCCPPVPFGRVDLPSEAILGGILSLTGNPHGFAGFQVRAGGEDCHGGGCRLLGYCSRSEAHCPVRIGQAVHPGAPGAVAAHAEQVVALALLNHHHGVACHLVCQAVLRLGRDGGQGHGHRSVAVERTVVYGWGRRQPAP